ncbi:uncharacterized protein LOC143596852 [Bidens hawaiensis]|uniref:uncharacterized protein LOC143596852 n=1 Tax=Bidens hawaiensis TaxID=980011 RepID=UPI004049C5EE
MVANSVSTTASSSNGDSYTHPSSYAFNSQIIVTDANNNNKFEITRTLNDVKDVILKKENDESKDIGACLEINHVEKSDNSVLRKLLRRTRYFDPQDCSFEHCYNCGEGGHTVTSCSAANRKKPCFICASSEHNGKQCKQGKGCFYCKKSGHFAKDCPEMYTEGVEKDKICLKCGDSGHEMYTCKTVVYAVDDLKEIKCYICNNMGHLCCVDYGEGPTEASCYRCGQLGHTGLKCTHTSSSVSAYAEASPSYCYKCGQEGHKSRKCKTSAKKRRRKKAKQSNVQDYTENVVVRSAPQAVDKGCNRNKTQLGYSTSSQPTSRGGWMDGVEVDEDPGGCLSGTQWGSLSTPDSYRSNKGLHGNNGSSDYTCDFRYEG